MPAGIAVLRYGNTRELSLGLEVVLPDGRVWDGLRGLRKDNTGYDLKQLFIGGEGTLGIITAATVKLFPKPREVETAFLGLRGIEDTMGLFARARAVTADQLTAFELVPRAGLDLALAHIPGTIDPLDARYPWYVLLEMSSSQTESGGIRAPSSRPWKRRERNSSPMGCGADELVCPKKRKPSIGTSWQLPVEQRTLRRRTPDFTEDDLYDEDV
jgi:FAD/FMN-containing dehydrogenase